MGIMLSKFRIRFDNHMMRNQMYKFMHFSACCIKNKFFGIMFAFERLCSCGKFCCKFSDSKKNDDDTENNIVEPILVVHVEHPPEITTGDKNDILIKMHQTELFELQPEKVTESQNVISIKEEPVITTPNSTKSDDIIIVINSSQDHITIDRSIVLHNLKLLTDLIDGQKPWLSINKLEIYSSYSSWIPGVRWIYAQSRGTIIPCIKDTILSAIILRNQHDKEISDLLTSSINGLEKLKVTYDTEHNDIDELIVLINNA